ncbi:DNA polymerase III subunit gamma/tau [Xanthobacter tagetidis]|uniref:DNA polymerase III subunit gamma/tau n=1 Tax=Xanthobacter tagetidis TaxID=60216 RepID=A0A3L7A4M4_9HYPH|nr:DNA polymerase III subunit gamma/tau [Xanthobacter tagetidis]MBB6309289.1 DNA polymerase-3 subunit gamma/tau [Xanthobacter tagetidis]RLP74242.1 DNA polymerase III subunit gamma/tau [Xanthobacter tagetidis]
MSDQQRSDEEQDGPGLDLGLADAAPARPAPAAAPAPYRVLARKYRPQNFEDLIGQEAMVRTLRNAFASGRIAQAYILTGVRGVGKTTTARILARALNYEPADGAPGGPTLDLSAFGRHCRDIVESRHVDVMEMDAASNTSINDIREIIESARYRPVMARYKVYIIDEVHMLSTAAFNGLLKTLEEPPEHVKFIFATTEIRKVPVTVLSRCQRFDLRRVEAGELAAHLSGICAKEGVTIEPEALAIVARAAEGSVRDSLSLLDQAIAHGGGRVSAEEVRRLLGLADKGRVIDLFEALMKGEMARALGEFRDQYDAGADPAVILTDLAEFTHLVTRLKIVPQSAEDAALVEAERLRGAEMAQGLSMRVLARAWQMLTKGVGEVQQAPKPAQAAEMVLVRLGYAADLPTPDEALRQLRDQGGSGSEARGPAGSGTGGQGGPMAATSSGARLALAPAPTSAPVRAPAMARPEPAVAGPRLADLADVARLCAEKRDLLLKHAVEHQLRPVHMEEGRIEVSLVRGAQASVVQDLSRKLSEWTGRRWLVSLASREGGPTLAEENAARKAEREEGIKAHPLVAAVLARFPGAEVVDVRSRADPAEIAGAEALPPMEEDLQMGPGPDDEIEY